MNAYATSLPDPKAGGDAHSGQGEVLGQVQVEVWPGTAGTLALRKPTVRRPLFPKKFNQRWVNHGFFNISGLQLSIYIPKHLLYLPRIINSR